MKQVGVGTTFLILIATNDFLGTKKFGVGPTVIALQKKNSWTYGASMNQIWSVAGDENSANVNQMYLQPFITYNWKSDLV